MPESGAEAVAAPGGAVRVAGLLLAAGAGTRMGGPKALVRGDDGVPWSRRGAERLRRAGCEPVVVVLGAAAPEAAGLLPAWAQAVVAEDWAAGASASLRRGIEAASVSGADAVLVTLVDLPDLADESFRRLRPLASREALARATYDGVPGHPVLIGAAHWPGLLAGLHGDSGARDYLREHGATRVECGDLGGGEDRDEPTF